MPKSLLRAMPDPRFVRGLAGLLLCAVAVTGISVPARADTSVEICNQGNTSLYVARVVYTQSLLFGDSYRAAGWYTVEQNRCSTVYDSENGDTVYFGFAYRDEHDTLRTWVTQPETTSDASLRAANEKFCASPTPFDYTVKTKEELQQCKLGFELLDFSMYLPPTDNTAVSYTMHAWEGDTDSAKFGTRSSARARLIYGDEVTLYGNEWRYANGVQLPPELIDSKTGLPPLLPRRQFSTGQAPVAENIRKIKDVLAGFQSCKTSLFGTQITSSTFEMDDYGVVMAAQSSTTVMTDGPHVITLVDGAAIGNLDLDQPAIVEQGPNCLSVRLACRNGACVRTGNATDSGWAFYLNNRDQVNIVLDALRAIAPYYPDGKGDIN
ncbi:MAG TPA: DUF1036 domain-containing protein [Steroidobacteraceae bacterium]|nr:DUF1036 domain-containing protein [Steroidobacteraceae bacterium]